MIVTGKEIPLSVNSELLELPEVTVTFDPLAVRVPVRFALFPMVTLPNGRDVGDTARVAGFVPVPDSGIDSVGLGALEVSVKVPLALPADVGAKVTVKLTLWPAVSVCGRLKPL